MPAECTLNQDKDCFGLHLTDDVTTVYSYVTAEWFVFSWNVLYLEVCQDFGSERFVFAYVHFESKRVRPTSKLHLPTIPSTETSGVTSAKQIVFVGVN